MSTIAGKQRWVAAWIVWLILPLTIRAQQAGRVDPSFGASLGLANNVYGATVEPDGKLLVYGKFKRGIVRLNADGSQDASVALDFGVADPSILSNVRAAIVQPDGKIIIVGYFDSINGVARNDIARLNADGSLDTGFDPGMGTNNFINAAVLQTDGRIIVGGTFTLLDGMVRNRIARFEADGRVDASFDPGMGVDADIDALALQPDGKILLGGKFTSVGGVERHGIARLGPDGGIGCRLRSGHGRGIRTGYPT